VNIDVMTSIVEAAQSKDRIAGLTHKFYRYPARFSPHFAHAAIMAFTKPGDLVLDPYMGGGTTIVEAIAGGRRAFGSDLNQLSVFVTRVKTTFLNANDEEDVWDWVNRATAAMSYRTPRAWLSHIIEDPKARNLTLPIARPVKKAVAAALAEMDRITSQRAKDFARCVLLRTAQWALDGRERGSSLTEVRVRLRTFASEMLWSLKDLRSTCRTHTPDMPNCTVMEINAAHLHKMPMFSTGAVKADLVVTSPPYPGVHVLYHRWQIKGRRETPAPYWITGCNDGQGASYYNFGDRHGVGIEKYFSVSLDTLSSVRQLVRDGGKIVQMIAFSDPDTQLPLYLANMRIAGFEELSLAGGNHNRIWRDVPSRKWHAALKGRTHSSREVVLVHEAV